MDYMMAGQPVICGVEAGNDPVAEADCGITIPAEDPAALAAAVRHLARLPPAERARLGRNGRAYVEQHHIYPVLARRFLAAIEVAAKQ